MTASLRRCSVLLLALTLAGPGLCADNTTTPDTPAARFKFLDVNQDGVVSKYEYDSEVALEMMDGDHDQRLSADELQAFLGPKQKGVPTAADRILIADLDSDGALDADELSRATEMRFGWMDRNGDGNLDLAELQAGFGVRVRP